MSAAPILGLSLDTLYHLVTCAALVGWVLLVVAPAASITRALVHSIIPALLLGAVYALLLARGALPSALPGAFPKLVALFGTEEAALAAWTHGLVFGLFIGAWETRDAAHRGVPHPAVIPCLILTMLLGPLGLFLYLLVRTACGRGSLALD